MQHAPDGDLATPGVQVFQVGLDGVRIALGDDDHGLVVVVRLAQRVHRALAPDEQRRDHAREQHGVAQRDDGALDQAVLVLLGIVDIEQVVAERAGHAEQIAAPGPTAGIEERLVHIQNIFPATFAWVVDHGPHYSGNRRARPPAADVGDGPGDEHRTGGDDQVLRPAPSGARGVVDARGDLGRRAHGDTRSQVSGPAARGLVAMSGSPRARASTRSIAATSLSAERED
jgi:hypothetical protein